MMPIEPLGHPTTALATSAMPEQLIDVDALAAAFGSLPVEGLVPAAVAVAMGGLLWWFGERLLRLAMMVVAVFVGVPLGMMLGGALAPALPPLAAAIAGAVVLLIAAAVGLRFAVAGGLAAVFGVAALLGTMAAVERGWIDLDDTPPIVQADGASVRLATLRREESDEAAEDEAETESPRSAWRELIDSMLLARDWAGERWELLPGPGRTLAVAAGAVGLVVGFGVGSIFQRFALRVATAVFGSLLILSGTTTMLGWLAPEWVAGTLPGGLWLGLWGVLSVVGAIVQWKRSATEADEE